MIDHHGIDRPDDVERMNPERKAEVVAALRSDRFQQGRGALTIVHEDGSRTHCCLGVMCVLAVEAGVIQETGMVVRDLGHHMAQANVIQYGEYEEASVLPDKVRQWLGLPSWLRNPRVRVTEAARHAVEDLGDEYERSHSSLAALNDHGVPFNVIADMIEDQL